MGQKYEASLAFLVEGISSLLVLATLTLFKSLQFNQARHKLNLPIKQNYTHKITKSNKQFFTHKVMGSKSCINMQRLVLL